MESPGANTATAFAKRGWRLLVDVQFDQGSGMPSRRLELSHAPEVGGLDGNLARADEG